MANFIEDTIRAFSELSKEIDETSSEPDIRGKFILHFIRGTLGYSGEDYRDEERKTRTDIRIHDKNGFRVLVFETKTPDPRRELASWKEYAIRYVDSATRYFGLTNGHRLIIWDAKERESPKVDLDFDAIFIHGRLGAARLPQNERDQILFLERLTKEALWDPSKYGDFNEYYAKIDIAKDFDTVLEQLNRIVKEVLLPYTKGLFAKLKLGYDRYLLKKAELSKQLKALGKREAAQPTSRELMALDKEYEDYKDFYGYELWKIFSNRTYADDEENKDVFCMETVYVLLNKLLFIRICEDKDLLPKNISNGGIESLRGQLKGAKEPYKKILRFAYERAGDLYSHFYENSLLDWYVIGDNEFDRALNRVLWILNRFDFKNVDRDILGNLYEKYLPAEERRRLGEFYTPVEVVDYILDAVAYTVDGAIEDKDLLDPACGSGTFLVRATNRLVGRFVKKFGKLDRNEFDAEEAKVVIEAIVRHVYGFDINPFACHITEMNLLFQILDLYKIVLAKTENYALPSFNIYRTDSLEMPETQPTLVDYVEGRYETVVKDQAEIESLKKHSFDFVVGNPPYVSLSMAIRRLSKEGKFEVADEYRRIIKTYRKAYDTPFKNFDLYMLFLERGIRWLKSGKRLGFICSDQFMTAYNGMNLRKYLVENAVLLQIIDFGESGVFEDVTNYPCIVILEKGRERTGEIICAKVMAPSENLLEKIRIHINSGKRKDDTFLIFAVPQVSLTERVWSLNPKEEAAILQRMRTKADKCLGDICDFDSGIRTGKDPLYIVKFIKEIDESTWEVQPTGYRKDGKMIRIERPLLKVAIMGKSVRKWRVRKADLYVIFPHKVINGNSSPIREEELSGKYPQCANYFKLHEVELKARKHYGKSAAELHGVWFSIMYPGKFYERAKILSPRLTNKSNFAIDRSASCFLGGPGGVVAILPHDDHLLLYLLGLLNSKLYEFLLKNTSQIKSGRYYQFGISHLKNYPVIIPAAEISKGISDKVNEIMNLETKLAEYRSKKLVALLEGMPLTRLLELPLIVFNVSGNRIDQIARKGTTVHFGASDSIECGREDIAQYVELYLQTIRSKLKNTNLKDAVFNIKVPKDKEDLSQVLKTNEAQNRAFEELPVLIRELEEHIDNEVFRLFEIEETEKVIVESYK